MMSGGSHETVVATYPRGHRDGPHLGSGMVWCGDPAGARARFLLPPPFALLFAPLGFLTGIIFSGILVGIERRRGFDRTSVSSFAGWGAASGFCCPGSSLLARPYEEAPRGESSWCSALPSPSRVRSAPRVRWPSPDVVNGESPATVGIRRTPNSPRPNSAKCSDGVTECPCGARPRVPRPPRVQMWMVAGAPNAVVDRRDSTDVRQTATRSGAVWRLLSVSPR